MVVPTKGMLKMERWRVVLNDGVIMAEVMYDYSSFINRGASVLLAESISEALYTCSHVKTNGCFLCGYCPHVEVSVTETNYF